MVCRKFKIPAFSRVCLYCDGCSHVRPWQLVLLVFDKVSEERKGEMPGKQEVITPPARKARDV